MNTNFDDIIKNRLEERTFPVDAGHRQDMIRLLDQSKRRKTGLFWWLGSIVLVGAFAGLLLFNKNSFVLEPQTPLQGPEQLKEDNAEIKNQAAAALNKDDQPGQVSEQQEANNSSVTLQQSSDVKSTDTPLSRESNHANATVTQQKKESNQTPPAYSAISEKPTSINAPAKKDVLSKVESKPEGQPENELLSPKNPSFIIEENKPEISVIPSANHEVLHEGTIAATQEPGIISEPAMEQQPVRNNYVTDPLSAAGINMLAYNFDAGLTVNHPILKRRHPVGLYAETGMNYIPVPQKKFATGWSMKAGGGLSYGLNDKIQLSVASGYMQQKNGFEFQRSATVQQYSFAARSNFHSLTPDKLHFVYGNVGVHYRVRHHLVSVLGGAQYLYGAQGNIAIQATDAISGVTEQNRYGWISLKGMNQWLWNAELQYGYQLMPRLSLHAGMKYYFSSIVAKDPELEEDGYYWNGDLSSLQPSFTIKYHLYGKK